MLNHFVSLEAFIMLCLLGQIVNTIGHLTESYLQVRSGCHTGELKQRARERQRERSKTID